MHRWLSLCSVAGGALLSHAMPLVPRSPLAAMTVTRRAELPLLLLASAARLWPPNCCLLPFRKLLPMTGRLLLRCCGALTALLAGRSTAAPVIAAMLPSWCLAQQVGRSSDALRANAAGRVAKMMVDGGCGTPM